MSNYTLDVQMTPEHIDRNAKVSPKEAIKELIWNSCDADATQVDISLAMNYLGDEIGAIEKIIVKDNGHGIKHEEINNIFDTEIGWGNVFYEYYKKSRVDNQFTEQVTFKHIDVEKCFNAIDKSTVKDLSDFRRTIGSIYGFSNIEDYYSADVENIDRLNSMLDKNYPDRMKQFNIKLLRENLDDISN